MIVDIKEDKDRLELKITLNKLFNFEKKKGSPKIVIGTEEILSMLKEKGYALDELELSNPGVVISNYDDRPSTTSWIFKKVKKSFSSPEIPEPPSSTKQRNKNVD